MWVIKDVPKAIYGLAISSRLIANHAFDRAQREREKRVATALQGRSYRLGTDERITVATSVRLCDGGRFWLRRPCATLMASTIMRSELMRKTSQGQSQTR